MRVLALGDAALDVLVELARPLEPDDDVPARITLATGGQAANVAAWCVALGAEAAVLAPLGGDASGRFVREQLAARGVGVLAAGSPPPAATPAIASLVEAGGRRSMASDRRGWAAGARLDGSALAGFEWLHLSGYELFGGDGSVALAAAEAARSSATTVSVDLAARTVVEAVGAGEARRRLVLAGAAVVFGTEGELAAVGVDTAGGHAPAAAELAAVATIVVKRGADGCCVGRLCSGRRRQWERHAAAPVAAVRDTTGAGDAFAAGYIVGGVELALQAAARCVEQIGAMPALGEHGSAQGPRAAAVTSGPG